MQVGILRRDGRGSGRQVFLKAVDLVGGNVHVSAAVGGQIEPSYGAHDLAPLVADGEAIVQDGEIGGEPGDREEQQSESQHEFSRCEHAVVVAPASLRLRTGQALPAVPRASRPRWRCEKPYAPTLDPPNTCSMAAATPLWSLGKVTAHPLRRNSSDAFPMINGNPAKASISMSL